MICGIRVIVARVIVARVIVADRPYGKSRVPIGVRGEHRISRRALTSNPRAKPYFLKANSAKWLQLGSNLHRMPSLETTGEPYRWYAWMPLTANSAAAVGRALGSTTAQTSSSSNATHRRRAAARRCAECSDVAKAIHDTPVRNDSRIR